ncbi:hypothetical protein ABLE93_02635 [Xanthobacter sp. KR7-65]|uniref:hypothetical protein n=1 Tax=Xanthobacter sp. KR7-65 TaxID=3156612 RepID=UPI0032B43671
MKWDKGNTTVMPRIVPGTTIRIRAPWQKKAPQRTPLRPGGPVLRIVETPPAEGEDKA